VEFGPPRVSRCGSAKQNSKCRGTADLDYRWRGTSLDARIVAGKENGAAADVPNKPAAQHGTLGKSRERRPIDEPLNKNLKVVCDWLGKRKLERFLIGYAARLWPVDRSEADVPLQFDIPWKRVREEHGDSRLRARLELRTSPVGLHVEFNPGAWQDVLRLLAPEVNLGIQNQRGDAHEGLLAVVRLRCGKAI